MRAIDEKIRPIEPIHEPMAIYLPALAPFSRDGRVTAPSYQVRPSKSAVRRTGMTAACVKARYQAAISTALMETNHIGSWLENAASSPHQKETDDAGRRISRRPDRILRMAASQQQLDSMLAKEPKMPISHLFHQARP